MKNENGLITFVSKRTVSETLDHLEVLLRERSIKVFARVNHASEAAAVGLSMPPTQVLIFGNPTAGTGLMLAAPSVAIDLPFRALVREHSSGAVWVSYNDPTYVGRRFGVADDQMKALEPLAKLIEQAVG